jgi:hypothetical protein
MLARWQSRAKHRLISVAYIPQLQPCSSFDDSNLCEVLCSDLHTFKAACVAPVTSLIIAVYGESPPGRGVNMHTPSLLRPRDVAAAAAVVTAAPPPPPPPTPPIPLRHVSSQCRRKCAGDAVVGAG